MLEHRRAAADNGPREIGKLLKRILRRNRDLDVRILLWDHSLFLMAERELFPRWIFGWHKPRETRGS